MIITTHLTYETVLSCCSLPYNLTVHTSVCDHQALVHSSGILYHMPFSHVGLHVYLKPSRLYFCPVITLTLPSSTTKLLVMLLKDNHLKDTLLMMLLKDIHLEYNELHNLPYSVNIMRILSFPIDREHMMLLSNERSIKNLSSLVTL